MPPNRVWCLNERFTHAAAIARIDLAHEPDFTLGQIEVRPSLREVGRDGRRESIDRRVMQVLVALARARGSVVSRDDLIESCWDGVVVGEDAINNCISRLRKAAEASGNVFSIETIPRVGYRLRIPENAVAEPSAASAAPQRPVYRGLQSLDEQDQEIFFGRDAPIAQGLDALRRMRGGSARSMLVILGASGAGKSSFLKAGLLSRLRQDVENFLVLPVIRPERAALTGARGLAASLVGDPAGLSGPHDFARLFASLREPVVERLGRIAESTGQANAARPPTIVIPIDQAEELFAAENTESGRVFELLADVVRTDRDAIILATIRPDAFEKLQNEPRLAEVRLLPFSLARLPHGAFKDVIEGPVRLANPKLAIEPALTERLLSDLATGDALPLLAFTMERLWLRHRGGETLTLAEYTDDLGGLQGAIKSAVDAAFAQAQRDPALPHERVELERLARAALIPALVHLDEADGEPSCRVERVAALPGATLQLVRHLVDQRLLVSDRNIIDGIATDTIEVAHAAILRQWPALRSWIAEERDALRALDGVRNAAREWRAHRSSADHGKSWFVHGSGRLEEVEQLLSPAHFAGALQPFEREYFLACRARDNAERERKRRRQIIVQAVAAAMTVLGILASAAGWIAYRRGNEALDARDQMAQGETRLLTQVATARLKEGDIPGAQRIIVEVLAHRQSTEINRAAAVSVFQEIRAEDRQVAVLGHAVPVSWATWSPDGKRIVTTSVDGTARIWDVATAAQLVVLRGHSDIIQSAAFSPDGRRIVTASNDKTARIWDAATGAQLAVLSGHGLGVNSAAFSPDGRRVVTASNDKTARIWDSATGVQLAVLSGHSEVVYSARFSPDAQHIVTASDNTAHIWDAASGMQLTVLHGHADIVQSAEFSLDGRRIVTASDDRTARIWDAATGAQLAVLSGHGHGVNTAAFSPDGRRVVTASNDKTARIWDSATGVQLAVLSGHSEVVYSARFSPDAQHIVTASGDNTARIWDVGAGPLLAVLSGHRETVNSAAFSPDGRRIVTASNDRTARTWDATTGMQLNFLSGHTGTVQDAAFSPDGRRVVTASTDKTTRIWDATTGAQLSVLSSGYAYTAVFSPDSQRILTAATAENSARIWDAGTGAQLAMLSGHKGYVFSAAFSPDGQRIVTASGDKTARLWDAARGAQLAVLSGHGDVVFSGSFARDGQRIVTASRDGTARIWSAATNMQLAVLYGHGDKVYSAEFSPDGQRVVTSSRDGSVRLWDATTGTQLAVIFSNGGFVHKADFSPDGHRIVTPFSDNTVRIWDAYVPAGLDGQIAWEEAAEFDALSDIERSELGLPPDPRVRQWENDVSKCDSAAAAPYDPDRAAPGVMQDQIAGDVAVSACTQANPGSGHSPRFDYQLGRALLAKRDPKGAANKFEAAVSAGYRSARVDLANLFVDPAAKMLDPARAVSLYEQAWQHGVPIAAFELGQLYEHGLAGKRALHPALLQNLAKAWGWYRKGADAGEPNALARFGEKDDNDAAAVRDVKKRDAILLKAFRHYAAAAERADDETWPDEAWKSWRYRRATLARLLAREDMMQQVADAYSGVRAQWQPRQPTLMERLRNWLP